MAGHAELPEPRRRRQSPASHRRRPGGPQRRAFFPPGTPVWPHLVRLVLAAGLGLLVLRGRHGCDRCCARCYELAANCRLFFMQEALARERGAAEPCATWQLQRLSSWYCNRRCTLRALNADRECGPSAEERQPHRCRPPSTAGLPLSPHCLARLLALGINNSASRDHRHAVAACTSASLIALAICLLQRPLLPW